MNSPPEETEYEFETERYTYMSYCENCGVSLDDGTQFCPNCGTPVRDTEEAQPQQTYETANQAMDKYQALEKLAGLKEKGILSDDEFAAEKEKVLKGGGAVSHPKPVYNARPVQPVQQAQPIVINNTNSNVNTVYSGMKPKDKWVALLLCIFLGFFGAHKFYEGKYLLGVVYILTFGLCIFGVIVDFFAILFKPNPYYC